MDLEVTWEQRAAARSIKKKYGHADILSSKLRSPEEAWEALGSLSSKLAKQQFAAAVKP